MDWFNFKKTMKPYKMAIISVFISVFSINIISLVSMAGKAEISKELDGVGMNGMTVTAYNSLNENVTDIDLYNILYRNENITRLTPVLYDSTTVILNTGKEINAMCWGISPMAKDIVNLLQIHGRMLSQSDVDNMNFVCLVDENIAKAAYGRSNVVGKDIYISIGQGIYKFNIAGVVNKTSNILNGMSGQVIPDFIYIPFTIMSNIGYRENLDQIIVNVTDEIVNEEQLELQIKQDPHFNTATRLSISNLSQQRESITNIVDLAFAALFAVSCVAIIVCSISVATSVNTAVIQSRHDIGIKLSLGAKKSEIMFEFLLYSLIASIIGIISGTTVGYITLKTINIIFDKIYRFDYTLLLSGISATILLTIIFSLYPSWQAASLLPVKALSRE